MNTEQSYNNVATEQTSIESAVKSSPPPVPLLIDTGQELTLVYKALTSYKTTLYEQAASDLIGRNVDSYIQSYEDIERIDLLLTEIFIELHECVDDMPADEFTRRDREDRKAKRLMKRTELLEKFSQTK